MSFRGKTICSTNINGKCIKETYYYSWNDWSLSLQSKSDIPLYVLISLWVKSQDITTSERESIQQLKVSHLRILGYSIAIPEQSSPYGPAGRDEQFWRSDLECQGDEESLEDCIGKDNPTCARGEVAGQGWNRILVPYISLQGQLLSLLSLLEVKNPCNPCQSLWQRSKILARMVFWDILSLEVVNWW